MTGFSMLNLINRIFKLKLGIYVKVSRRVIRVGKAACKIFIVNEILHRASRSLFQEIFS